MMHGFVHRWLLPFAVLLLASANGLAQDSEVERRLAEHVDRAVRGGLKAHDFHHLLLAFGWRQTLPDWSLIEPALDRLSAAPGDPLMSDEVRFVRAQVAVDQGRPALARELFRAMGGLSRWWALEPRSLQELEDFDDLATYPEDEASWRAVPGTDPLGWVRLAGLAWPARRQLLYLATTVESERRQPVAVRVGAAQAARVWLNGVEVLTSARPLEHAEDQAAAGGWLGSGSNLVVVAVASESADWWLRVRLTAPDGSTLDGVSEVDARPRTPAPVRRDPPLPSTLEGSIRAAIDDGRHEARLALAAFLATRHPEPVESGVARAACRAARTEAPAEARFLEWYLTTEPAAVRELLEAALKEDPDLPWVRVALARWLHDRGLDGEAAALLPDSIDEPMARANLLSLDASLWGPVVLPRLEAVSQRWPRCVEAALLLAERAVDFERWPLAREALARLQAVAPGWRGVYAIRDRLASACGDGQALGEVLDELLEHDPNRPDLRVRLARLRAAGEDVNGARTLLEEGLVRCSDHPELLLELARLEHSQGQDERAMDLVRRLRKVRPQDRRGQRLAELLGEAGEDLSWRRSPAELWQMADTAPAGSPAVVLLEHVEIRFLPRNLTEERVQRAVLITAGQRADAFLRHTLAWVPERQRLRVLSARVLRRDGSEVSARQGDTPRLADPEINLYYDTRLRVLGFEQLEDGDLIEISYVLSETAEANETGPYKGGVVHLGREVPIALAEIELVGPEESMPSWELARLDSTLQRIRDDAGTLYLRWRWHDLPPIPRDVPSAPASLVAPYLVYSSHPRWRDLADWYARHVTPRVRASRQVVETAERLTRGVEERRARIARLYRFVTDDIRYVGLELGEHRFRPFSADWVLNHRIGDCKDKAALLVALLGSVDIPARMVLLRTADIGPAGVDIALLESFNHTIVYLPEDDQWLDGTATGHDPSLPPALDQGALALVIDDRADQPRITPSLGVGVSRLHYSVVRLETGSVELVVRSKDTGQAATQRRAVFAGSNDPRRFARWLQDQFPGAELLAEPVEHMPPGRDPAIIELRASVPRSALLAGGGIATYPGRLELVSELVPAAQRQTPLLVLARPDLKWTLEVTLARLPRPLPPAIDLLTPFGELSVEFATSDSGYRVDGELTLRPGLVALEEVVALRDFLVTVERHLSRPLEAP